MTHLNGKAIFSTLALARRRLAKLYSRPWRWRNIDQQSYLPYVGASKRRKLSSLHWRWRSASLQSYIPYFGAGEASTSKAIFLTLALANADVQSYLPDFGAGEASTCKAIFPTLALGNTSTCKGKPILLKKTIIFWFIFNILFFLCMPSCVERQSRIRVGPWCACPCCRLR